MDQTGVNIVQVAKRRVNERSIAPYGYKGRRNRDQTRGQDVSPWVRKLAAVMAAAEKGGRA